MKRVVILQRIVPHYRLSLFDRMAARLKREGVDFEVVYGQEHPGTVPKSIHVQRDWATFARNSYVHIGGLELTYQHIPVEEFDADLVIIEHASRLLHNYTLLFRQKKRRKLAFWGHGRDMKSNGGPGEWLKARLLNRADWYFAYTDLSRDIVLRAGFPVERVTVTQNTIETEALQQHLDSVDHNRIPELLAADSITGKNMALFCGGLRREKKLAFLIDAAALVRAEIEDFELVVIGTGPEEGIVRAAASRYEWVHYLGPKFGHDLAPYLSSSKLLLMPGLVGLVIVDSFVAGVPLVTTDNGIHSPEIAYLENGVNGVMTDFDVKRYASAVVDLLQSPEKLEHLRAGCRSSAKHYTIHAMVENMAGGILACLTAPRR